MKTTSFYSSYIFTGLIIGHAINAVTPDPCESYKTLPNGDQRSNGSITTTAHCDDKLSAGWYRSEGAGGSDMARQCPEMNRCGTVYPVWMDHEIPPADGKEHDSLAYFRLLNDCKFKVISIKVKNCGDYRVWYLRPTYGCPSGYCFGKRTVCKEGQSSEDGFEPCSRNYPKHSQTPSFNPDIGTRDRDTSSLGHAAVAVTFTCHLPNPDNFAANVTMDVEFYSTKPNGDRLKLYPPEGQRYIVPITAQAVLYQNDFYTANDARDGNPSPIGKNFSCSIRTRYGNSGIPGPYHYSAGFFVGLKVINEESLVYNIAEGEDVQIKVKPTIPIFRTSNQPVVNLNFALKLPNYQQSYDTCSELSIFSNIAMTLKDENCEFQVNTVFYDESSWSAIYNNYMSQASFISLHAQQDGVDVSSVMHVKFQKSNSYPDDPMWSYYTLPDIKVVITDRDNQLHHQCESINDPHMRTYAGTIYEFHKEGEFILHKHKRLPEEVHLYTKKCNGVNVATCNCGLAIRAGKDIFIDEMCSKDREENRPMRLGYYGCDQKTMRIYENGRQYTIIMPSGTEIQVVNSRYNFYDYMDVIVKPSPADMGQTEGLCGSTEEDMDFTHRNEAAPRNERNTDVFGESWRVRDGESLYKGETFDKGSYAWNTYCSCDGNNKVDCSITDVIDRCLEKGKEISKIMMQKCEKRKKREVANQNVQYNFTYDKDFVPQPPTWQNNWTEVKAIEYCTKYIKDSSPGRACAKAIPDLDFDRPIENCKNDIHLSGDTGWRKSSLLGLIKQCENELKKNTSLWKNDTVSGKFVIPNEILDNMCLDNCSDNGICKNGTCQCFDGFAGNECSMNLNEAPSDVYIATNEDECERKQDTCNEVSINSDYFADTDRFRCRSRHCKIRADSTTCSPAVILEEKPTFEHFERVDCPLSGSTKRKRSATVDNSLADVYYISVANNGVNFSSEVAVVVYDSECIECNITSKLCSIKDNYCYIQEVCHSDNKLQQGENCKICDVSASRTEWSDVLGGSCQTGTNSAPTALDSTTLEHTTAALTDSTTATQTTTPSTTSTAAKTATPPTSPSTATTSVPPSTTLEQTSSALTDSTTATQTPPPPSTTAAASKTTATPPPTRTTLSTATTYDGKLSTTGATSTSTLSVSQMSEMTTSDPNNQPLQQSQSTVALATDGSPKTTDNPLHTTRKESTFAESTPEGASVHGTPSTSVWVYPTVTAVIAAVVIGVVAVIVIKIKTAHGKQQAGTMSRPVSGLSRRSGAVSPGAVSVEGRTGWI